MLTIRPDQPAFTEPILGASIVSPQINPFMPSVQAGDTEAQRHGVTCPVVAEWPLKTQLVPWCCATPRIGRAGEGGVPRGQLPI